MKKQFRKLIVYFAKLLRYMKLYNENFKLNNDTSCLNKIHYF
jgi:hypothetical protein